MENIFFDSLEKSPIMLAIKDAMSRGKTSCEVCIDVSKGEYADVRGKELRKQCGQITSKYGYELSRTSYNIKKKWFSEFRSTELDAACITINWEKQYNKWLNKM